MALLVVQIGHKLVHLELGLGEEVNHPLLHSQLVLHQVLRVLDGGWHGEGTETLLGVWETSHRLLV